MCSFFFQSTTEVLAPCTDVIRKASKQCPIYDAFIAFLFNYHISSNGMPERKENSKVSTSMTLLINKTTKRAFYPEIKY